MLRKLCCTLPLLLLIVQPWAAFAEDDLGNPLPANETPVVCPLAASGEALQTIVIASTASQRTRAVAATLADYLSRISGAKFKVEEGNGRTGLVVGTFDEVSARRIGVYPKWIGKLAKDDPRRREEYLLHSHREGVHVVGATDAAVEHAVWDFLYRLGYRQFFPGKNWEVIPSQAELSVAVHAWERPDYHVRRIWYGYGPWDYAAAPYREWCAKNRAVAGIALSTGHAYDGIIARNRETLAQHPEYLGLYEGERKSSKLCIGNPGLRQMVIDDAFAQIAKNPALDSISLDPSDGLKWCECERCQALGSIPNRALTLANEVAEAINKQHPGVVIGMYAYSAHSPPPTIQVHPRVVISVATAFIYGGFTVDELLSGWQQQGATLGIREYYSVNTWDRDLPGKARGGNLDYIRTSISHFHELGARYFSSESSDNWAPNGLGYYLASRLLWNVAEAGRADEIVDDFFTRAFGDARPAMEKFYKLLDTAQRPLLSDDLVGRMYRTLREARGSTTDAAVLRRIDDLLLYTRYVELWLDYSFASGEARQQAFEALIRHAYRMRETMMVHTKGLYRDLDNRDKSVTIPDDAKWNVAEDKNSWKSGAPFDRAELAAMEAAGIERRPIREFEAVSYSRNLVPAKQALNLPEVTPGSAGIYLRGKRTYYTLLTNDKTQLSLTATAGIIYPNRGPAKISLTPFDGEHFPENNTEDNPPDYVAEASVEPDKAEHAITLAGKPGLHLLEVTDRSAGSQVAWEAGQTMTLESSMDRPAALYGRWTMYFYVPRGTKLIGGYTAGEGRLLDPSGKLAHTFSREAGYFQVPVPAGQDGQLWKFDRCAGQRLLMTVPPYLARSAEELLLPEEVIARDR